MTASKGEAIARSIPQSVSIGRPGRRCPCRRRSCRRQLSLSLSDRSIDAVLRVVFGSGSGSVVRRSLRLALSTEEEEYRSPPWTQSIRIGICYPVDSRTSGQDPPQIQLLA